MKVSTATLNLIRGIDSPLQQAIDEVFTHHTELLREPSAKRDTEFDTIWHLAGREEAIKQLELLRRYLSGYDLTD
jgi:hypothetical protein